MKNSGWHEGWYMAVVKKVVNYSEGTVIITYVVEPSQSYEISVKELWNEKFLMLVTEMNLNNFSKSELVSKLSGHKKNLVIQIGNQGGIPEKSKNPILKTTRLLSNLSRNPQ